MTLEDTEDLKAGADKMSWTTGSVNYIQVFLRENSEKEYLNNKHAILLPPFDIQMCCWLKMIKD